MSFLRYLSLVRSALPQLLPLMRDARVPQWLKTSTIVSALLIVSPLDLLGDIPVLGIFDDATLLAILMTAFVHFATSMRRQDEEEKMRNVTPAGQHLPPSKA
jgi:uncharacterized membrane protein YkvA (DUF1232 family)